MAEMVLNPKLFRRLERVFGRVRIGANRGVSRPANAGGSASLFGDGSVREDFGRYEQYTVCCPCCRDTRFRLSVSYLYGQVVDGHKRLGVVRCWNENCMEDPNRRARFEDLLDAGGLDTAKLRRGKPLSAQIETAAMPGRCVRLDKLPERHHARVYVAADRHFDPDELAREYGVAYCEESEYSLATDRLIFPFYWMGRLVGWQSRYIGELPWKDPVKGKDLPPKYWTKPGTPKGRILGNFDVASKYKTGVIVEGWFDVCGFGPMAMPIFGNTMSPEQRQLFADRFGKDGRTGVLLIDPEEYEAARTMELIKELRYKPMQLAAVRLPPKTDPGSLDRDWQRAYVEAEAAKQGVPVSWELHEETALVAAGETTAW